MTTNSAAEWCPLLDWAGEVATRVLDYYETHADELTEAQAVRGRLIIGAAERALAARDAVSFRAAISEYSKQTGA